MTHGVTIPQRAAESLFGQIRDAASLPVRDPYMTGFLAGGDEAACALVLEAVANGRMLSEIAAHYDIPMMVFHNWVDSHIYPADLDKAKRVGAESLMVAARTLRAEFPSGSVDAQYLNRYATHCERVAERLDPGAWGPPKVATGGASVVLNLNFGQGDQRQVKAETIDAEVVPGFGDEPLPAMEALPLSEALDMYEDASEDATTHRGKDTAGTPLSPGVGAAVLRALGGGLV